jgi:hypothetical protein
MSYSLTGLAAAPHFRIFYRVLSQVLKPRLQPTGQQTRGHQLYVSRAGGFRYVSAADPAAAPTQRSPSARHRVILCLGWMGCKEKHLDKVIPRFCVPVPPPRPKSRISAQVARLWLALSPTASVLTYQPSPSDVLWPRQGLRTAEKIVASLPRDSQIIVHGFSTGGFLYSLMIPSFVSAMRSNRCQVTGCVFDCAVDIEGIADGMANAISDHKLIQALVRSMTSMYLRVTHSVVMQMYVEASHVFKNPPAELTVPVLSFLDILCIVSLPLSIPCRFSFLLRVATQ